MTLGGPVDLAITAMLAIRTFGVGRTLLATILLTPVYLYALPLRPCGCIRPPFVRCAPSQPFQAAMKADLKYLTSQQEIYFSDHGTYSADAQALTFAASDGVVVAIHAEPGRWGARATHIALGNEKSCAIYLGDGPPAELGPTKGAGSGLLVCS